MARRSGKIGILQLDALGVSWMRVQSGNQGVQVLEYIHVPAENTPEAQAEALRSLDQTHGVAGDALCTVLPRHEITARVLVLPTQDPAEAASMVRLNAEEYVPYALNELILDTRIVETLPNGESRVFAVLAHKDVVENHVALLRRAGLVPQRIFLSTACLASAAVAARLGERGPCALAHLGANSLEVIVIRELALHFTRGVATAQDWRRVGMPEGGDALEELTAELRSSLSAYRRESDDGMGVDVAYLGADHLDSAAVCGMLNQNAGIEIQSALLPEAILDAEGIHPQHPPWILLGAALTALGRATLEIDLLPEDLAKARQSAHLQRLGRQALLAAMAVFAALGLYFVQQIHARKGYLRELEAQVGALAPQARGIAMKRQQLGLLQDQVERNGTVLQLIAQATEVAPDSHLTLTQFEYDSEKGMNFFGRARQREDVVKYSQDLRDLAASQLPLWAAASVLYIQEGMEFDKYVFMFQIQVRLDTEGEGETGDAAVE